VIDSLVPGLARCRDRTLSLRRPLTPDRCQEGVSYAQSQSPAETADETTARQTSSGVTVLIGRDPLATCRFTYDGRKRRFMMSY
jgi:hypothetical protein